MSAPTPLPIGKYRVRCVSFSYCERPNQLPIVRALVEIADTFDCATDITGSHHTITIVCDPPGLRQARVLFDALADGQGEAVVYVRIIEEEAAPFDDEPDRMKETRFYTFLSIH